MDQARVRSRWPAALAVAVVTVPAVVLAHLLTAGTTPSPYAVAVVAATVVLVALLVRADLHRPGALVAVVSLGQLAGHAVLSVWTPASAGGGGCLPVMGRGAELGLRLAVLRTDGSCPPGSLALTSATTAAVAALLAAGTALVCQLVLAAAGALLLGAGERAWTSACLLAAAVTRLARTLLALGVLGLLRSPVPPGTPIRAVGQVRPRWSAGRRVVAVHARRGPPLPA